MAPLASWQGADTSYLQNLQNVCHYRPSLKLLKTLSNLPEHLSRIRVLVVTDNSNIHDVEINKLLQLDAYLSSPPICTGRLYLVEDISLPWISPLGNYFDIDPRFFTEYVMHRYFVLGRSILTQTDFLPACIITSSWICIERAPSSKGITPCSDCRLPALKVIFGTFVYHEIRTFDGCAPRREEYEILTTGDVARLVTTVDHHCERATGLIRRNLGVWEEGGDEGDDKYV